jgi:putative transposase
MLEAHGIAISMDGRGRVIDNVFIERLWRSVKYEEVYLKDYVDGWQADASLAAYFRFYNRERIHQALGYRTPWEVYREQDSSRRRPQDENEMKSRARKRKLVSTSRG